MKARAFVPGLVGLGILLLLPHVSQAQCNRTIAFIPDGRVQAYTIIFGVDMDTAFVFDARAGRSYHVDVQTNENSAEDISGNINQGSCVSTNHASFRNTDDVDPSTGIGFSGNSLRGSFTATTNNFHGVRVRAATTNVQVLVKIVETTLFSPRWAVFTSTGFLTAWGFTNTTNSSIDCTLTLKDDTGMDVGSPLTFTVPANSIAFRDTTTNFPGITSASGRATLTHNGTPGAILADAYIVGPKPFIQQVRFDPRNSQ